MFQASNINHEQKSIPMDETLNSLGGSFLNFLTEVSDVPKNTRYLCSLRSNGEIDPIKLSWGWSEDDKKGRDNCFTLEELKKMKYQNNLETIIEYTPSVTLSVQFVFPCLECIRRYVSNDTPIYFVGGTDCTYVFL